MSKLYDITILGRDDPGSWLCAAAFCHLDLRVLLIMESVPDTGLPCCYWLPLDPSRVTAMAEPFGLKPTSSPHPSFVPDLQVIVAGQAVDIIADAGHSSRNLERDLQEAARDFSEVSRELCWQARQLLSSARENGFPLPGQYGHDTRPWQRWLKGKSWQPPQSPPVSQWARGLPDSLRAVFMAAATASLGSALRPEAPLLQLSLLWLYYGGMYLGPGPESDFREQVAKKIAKRGSVMEAEPDAIIAGGRTLRSLRLKGGSVIDTKVLIAPASTINSLLDLAPRTGPEPASPEEVRKTFFYTIERATVPESWARRVVVVRDPAKPLLGNNLFIVARAPRVPRRDTMAVTTLSPPPELEPETVPRLLASTLPWLDPELIQVDDTREPSSLSMPAPPPDLDRVSRPRLPLENVFPLPAEIIPAWGPMGVALSIQGLVLHCSELLNKYKDRHSW